MMKAIILARVSDKKQDSNEAQIVRISDYIKYKDLTVWKTHEIEESSTRGERKKFQNVIKEIKKSKECIALVVDTVDRLQRSFKESVLLDDLRKAGKIEIHFYRENLVIHKNSNSADLLRWDMAVMFARSYILQLSDNVKRKFEQLRRSGVWVGKAPIGYKNIGGERNRDIILDPNKSHFIKRLFEMYASQPHSIKTLCIQITNEGLRNELGNPLAPSMIYHILNNPFYYGVMRTNGELYQHKYARLIDKELYVACQKKLKGWHKTPFQYSAKPFVFRGLLRCAVCGCAMSPEIKKGKYIYYSCTNARKEVCSTKTYVREEALLQPLYNILDSYIHIPQDLVEEIVALMKFSGQSERKFNEDAIRSLRAEYDSIQAKQNRLTNLLLEGIIAANVYEEKLNEFKERQHDINIQIEDHTNADRNYCTTAEIVLRIAKSAPNLLRSSETPRKRAIVKLLIQNAVVNGENLEFTLRSPFNVIYEIASNPVGRGALGTFRTLDWKQIQELLDQYFSETNQEEDNKEILPTAC